MRRTGKDTCIVFLVRILAYFDRSIKGESGSGKLSCDILQRWGNNASKFATKKFDETPAGGKSHEMYFYKVTLLGYKYMNLLIIVNFKETQSVAI